MAWMIGIDEAGYGPNLGPLTVSATVWKVESEARKADRVSDQSQAVATSVENNVDLYARLAALVSPTVQKNRLAIADSKALYKPKGGLQNLERGVLAALAVSRGKLPTRWQDLIEPPPQLPWYGDFDCCLPIDATSEELQELAAKFSAVCDSADVELTDVRTRLVFPREFNELTEQYGTKGAALSHVTIGLLRQTIDSLPPGPRIPTSTHHYISCDKHGGRNRYAALLQHHFSEHWIETHEESTPISRYSWSTEDSEFHISFQARGESQLPTALASMTAKYHRELAMRAFNAYWCQLVPNLKPTAGYPVDAKRFKQAIASKQIELGIEDADLWRYR